MERFLGFWPLASPAPHTLQQLASTSCHSALHQCQCAGKNPQAAEAGPRSPGGGRCPFHLANIKTQRATFSLPRFGRHAVDPGCIIKPFSAPFWLEQKRLPRATRNIRIYFPQDRPPVRYRLSRGRGIFSYSCPFREHQGTDCGQLTAQLTIDGVNNSFAINQTLHSLPIIIKKSPPGLVGHLFDKRLPSCSPPARPHRGRVLFCMNGPDTGDQS